VGQRLVLEPQDAEQALDALVRAVADVPMGEATQGG
jgi:hypothetical protein